MTHRRAGLHNDMESSETPESQFKMEVETNVKDKGDNAGANPTVDSVVHGRDNVTFVMLVTHFNIFLYATCFWIQTGTLPYLTTALNVDTVQFGYLQTTFAIVQLAGGPVFGRFGDLFGGRAAMTLAFVSSTLTYLLLGLATNIPLLFLSRLPSVFMHAMQGGQMIVTDLGEEHQRADALGKLGLSYGVGMIVGPFIGGLIAKYYSPQMAALFAAAGSALSVVLVWLFIPAHTKRAHGAEEKSGGRVLNIKKIMSLIFAPGAFFLLGVRMASGLPIGIFQSMFSMVALEYFHLPPEQNGYLLSYMGVLTMVCQGVGLGLVLKTISENTIVKWSSVLLAFAYLLLSQVTTVWHLCVVSIPLVVGLSFQNIVITSVLTKAVTMADTGAMLGLNMAGNSLIRSVSPTVGAFMLEQYGFPSFGYLGCILLSGVTLVLFIKFKQ